MQINFICFTEQMLKNYKTNIMKKLTIAILLVVSIMTASSQSLREYEKNVYAVEVTGATIALGVILPFTILSFENPEMIEKYHVGFIITGLVTYTSVALYGIQRESQIWNMSGTVTGVGLLTTGVIYDNNGLKGLGILTIGASLIMNLFDVTLTKQYRMNMNGGVLNYKF